MFGCPLSARWVAELFVRFAERDVDFDELPDARELGAFVDPLERDDELRGRAGEDARVAIGAD
ncbi:MAG: hypothetical protein ACRC8U_14350, partial [Brooklawnia sp.]